VNLIKQTIIACAFALATSNVAFAAVLRIENDILMGASGVLVDGVLYDVSFRDGPNTDLLSPFTTQEQATSASLALLSQVLIDDYDTLSKKTNGCTHNTACIAFTSYGRDSFNNVLVVEALNRRVVESSSLGDGTPLNVLSAIGTTVGETASARARTLAFWSASTPVAAVPEPKAYAMMFAGLGLLGFVSRRRKQKAAV